MLWILFFLGVSLGVAYRRLALAQATGAFALAVLTYGSLGENLGVFFLLVLTFFVVVLPLNAPSLRQEWFTRPLLARIRQQRSTLPLSQESGETLNTLLKTAHAPPLLAANGLDLPCNQARIAGLSALLQAMLQRPLSPFIAEPEQVAHIEQLYFSSLAASAAPQSPAQQQLHERICQQYTPSASEPQAKPPSLLWQFPLCSDYAALLDAVRIGHSAQAQLAVDATLWRFLGLVLHLAAQSLLITLRAIFASVLPPLRPADLHWQALTLRQLRCRLVLSAVHAHQLFKGPATGASVQLEQALPHLWLAAAAYRSLSSSADERKQATLTYFLLQLHQADQRTAEAIAEFDVPWLVGALRWVSGIRLHQQARVRFSQRRATAEHHLSNLTPLITGIESCEFSAEFQRLLQQHQALQSLHSAIKNLAPDHRDRPGLSAALQNGLINHAQYTELQAALDFSETLTDPAP